MSVVITEERKQALELGIKLYDRFKHAEFGDYNKYAIEKDCNGVKTVKYLCYSFKIKKSETQKEDEIRLSKKLNSKKTTRIFDFIVSEDDEFIYFAENHQTVITEEEIKDLTGWLELLSESSES